jgi:hypothetical protein
MKTICVSIQVYLRRHQLNKMGLALAEGGKSGTANMTIDNKCKETIEANY